MRIQALDRRSIDFRCRNFERVVDLHIVHIELLNGLTSLINRAIDPNVRRRKSTDARVERKHARMCQRQGKVLSKRFRSGPEELAAKTQVILIH